MSEPIKTTLKIDGEKEFKAAISNSSRALILLNAEMRTATARAGENKNSVAALTAKNELLTKSVIAQKDKIETMERAVKAASEKFGENSKQADEWRIKLENAKTTLAKTENAIDFNNRAIAEMNRQMGDGKVQKWSKDLQKADAVISKGLNVSIKAMGTAAVAATASVGALTAKSISDFSGFEDSVKEVQATMGLTGQAGEDAYNKLSTAAKKAGQSTRFTASDAAHALNYLALAGYDVNKSISVLPGVLDLAAAGGMDLARASDLVTDGMAALGLSTEHINEYMDKMARTAQRSNTAVSQLGEATLKVAGTATSAGQNLDVINTMLGVLANKGIKGAEGGTKLRNIILSLTAPTGAAAKALDSLNISASNGDGTIRDLTDIFIDLNSAMSKMVESDRVNTLNTIFNKQDLAGVNALLAGTSGEMQKLQAEIENSNGAAADMAQIMESGLGGSTRSLESSVESLSITFGEQFGPLSKSAVKSTTEAIDELTAKVGKGLLPNAERNLKSLEKSYDKFIKNSISGASDLAIGFIENIDIIVASFKGLAAGVVAFKGITVATKLATEGLQAYGKVSAAVNLAKNLTTPAGLATIAIGGLIGVTVGLMEAEKKAKEKAKQINLEQHFGKLALSMEEVENTARRIVRTRSMENLEKSMQSLKNVKDIAKKIDGSIDTLNKLNWKVGIGLELTDDEKESYKSSITEFIAETQNSVTESQYAVNMSIDALFGETSKTGGEIKESLNSFYATSQNDLATLGKKLQNAVNDAYEDGLLDIDEAKEIAEIQRQMASMTAKLSQSKLDAELNALKIEFSGAELTPESYADVQTRIGEISEQLKKDCKDAFIMDSTALQLKIDAPTTSPIEKEKLEKQLADVEAAYKEKLGEISMMGVNFGVGTITDAYGDEIGAAITDYFDYIRSEIAEQEEIARNDPDMQMFNLDDLLMGGIEAVQMDETTRNALSELYKKNLKPQLEDLLRQAEEYAAAGKAIPENIAKGISDISAIGAITGETNSMMTVIGQVLNRDSGEFGNVLEAARKHGDLLNQNIALGMNLSRNSVIQTCTTLGGDTADTFGNAAIPKFKKYSNDAAQGAVDQMKSRGSDAYASGAFLARRMAAGYKDHLEINSPSKLFRRITNSVPEGAIKSLHDNAGQVYAAGKDLAIAEQNGYADQLTRQNEAFKQQTRTQLERYNGYAYARQAYSSTSNDRNPAEIDYDRLGFVVASAIAGLGIYVDKRQLGKVVELKS